MGRYDFRHNEITGAIDFRKHESTSFKPFDLTARNTLLVELNENFIKCSEKQLLTLLMSDFSPKYNPLVEYLQGLRWDGEDHLAVLTNSVKTDDDEFFKTAFRKFMLASVAAWENEEHYNELMVILIGEQNSGKSTFVRNLVPQSLQNYFFQGTVLQNQNDFLKQLSRKALILLDEFDSVSGKDIPRLKELITRKVVETRLAYQKDDMKETRRASFMATTNISQPLKDLSGNRRFLCFSISSIDWEAKIDIDQVYAQLYNLYKQGENFKLTKNEVVYVNKRNERFTYQDVLVDAILTKFKPTKAPDAERLTIKELAKTIIHEAGYLNISHSLLTKLGTLMNNAGFERRKSNGTFYYLVQREDRVETGVHKDVERLLNTALLNEE